MTNSKRFRCFIDRINRRQWEFLGDAVQGRLLYNKHDMSLYDFTQRLKQEFAPGSTITMDVVHAVSDDNDSDGPRGNDLNVWDEAERQSQAQSVVLPPGLRPPPPRTSIDLRQLYADYIACINSGAMSREFGRFCKPSGVVWNGTRMTVAQYGAMIQASLDAISGLHFDVHTLVVEESRQQLAARLEFTGTPVKPYAGAAPNGRPVVFTELVFYWFEQGKISDVLSIVDWAAYRAQLAQ